MGAANRRGPPEVRLAQARQLEQERLDLIEAKKQRRRDEEVLANMTMVWWQLEMSEERERLILKRRSEAQLGLVSLLGMAYGGGWGGFGGLPGMFHR